MNLRLITNRVGNDGAGNEKRNQVERANGVAHVLDDLNCRFFARTNHVRIDRRNTAIDYPRYD